jgi:cell pole-organizing protein PopZ
MEEEVIAVDDEALVSDMAADATSSAFAGLSAALGSSRIEGRTMEDIVKELLRPMLKEWLDANLPSLVEQIVREEVERLSRRR